MNEQKENKYNKHTLQGLVKGISSLPYLDVLWDIAMAQEEIYSFWTEKSRIL